MYLNESLLACLLATQPRAVAGVAVSVLPRRLEEGRPTDLSFL